MRFQKLPAPLLSSRNLQQQPQQKTMSPSTTCFCQQPSATSLNLKAPMTISLLLGDLSDCDRCRRKSFVGLSQYTVAIQEAFAPGAGLLALAISLAWDSPFDQYNQLALLSVNAGAPAYSGKVMLVKGQNGIGCKLRCLR